MTSARSQTRAALALGLIALAASCEGSGPEEDRGVIGSFNPGFSLRQDVQLGSGNVTDAEVVDLNGDGIDDVLETDFFDKTVSAALGNPDGSFTPLFRMSTPSTPWALDMGDYNGDGERDLAVVCTSNSGGLPTLVVYVGLGGGSFRQDAMAVLPSNPSHLDSGVVPGTSLEQIFVALPDAPEIWQFELTAPGILSNLHRFPSTSAGTFAPVTVAVLDANGDGMEDVIVGEINLNVLGNDQIVMHLADGLGGFAAPSFITPIANYPLVENVGDIDGNGFDDLAAPQLESDRALFFLGSALGLGAAREIPFTGNTSSIHFADFDGDGLTDVAAALVDESAIGVRLATAPTTFGPLEVYNAGELPRTVRSGHFGSDDERDLLCANTRDLSIFSGDGAGGFRGATGFPVGDEPQFVRTVDMDGDGILDVVSIDRFQNKVVFMKGMGDGRFQNTGQVPLAPSSVEVAGYLQVHDFDEDGRPDVGTTVHSTGEFRLIRGSGSLPLTAPLNPDSTSIGNEPLGFDAGDLNGDGHLDVVVANSGDSTIQVLIGAGDGTFSARGAVTVPARAVVVLVEDWNADGDLDVAVATGDADGSNTFLFLYRGDGSGDLALASQQVLPELATVLSSADFNEDGLPDLAASQTQITSNEIVVLLNLDAFAFSLQTIPVGFRMGTLEVFDINQDTHLDIVVPLRDGELVLVLGNGNGQFPTILPPGGEQFPAPHRVTASSFADVNGDGLPDLLMVSPSTPHLWVALNDGTEL